MKKETKTTGGTWAPTLVTVLEREVFPTWGTALVPAQPTGLLPQLAAKASDLSFQGSPCPLAQDCAFLSLASVFYPEQIQKINKGNSQLQTYFLRGFRLKVFRNSN